MGSAGGVGASAGTIDPADLVALRAALVAGASPGEALAHLRDGALGVVARSVRLGRPVAEEAAEVDTGDPAADLLVRALGVAEQAGVSAGAAVAQSLRAVRDGMFLERLLEVRTAQARATAAVLSCVPLGGWVLLVALDPQTLTFYTTPLGMLTGTGALLLAGGGRLWVRRLVRRVGDSAAEADPLVPARPPADAGRAAVVAVPVLLAGTLLAGVALGLAAALAAGLALRRPKRPVAVPDLRSGGAAETTELVAVAVAAGMPTVTAVETVARLAPPVAREAMAVAARRLGGGWDARAAFERSGLDVVGRVLATADRWGAPAAGPLRELAEDLRTARRAAAEAAAERVQVALVFPTTLLTLPSFVLAVVPPLLWTAFAGGFSLV